VRIEIFTEYKRNGVTYHAHPNYNSFGEWYDWAMVKFELENDNTNLQEEEEGYYGKNLFPAKILCFVHAKDETIHAVIHCCNTNNHSEDSILVEHWKKEFKVEDNMLVPLLRCVSVDTFETPCFVVEDKHGLNEEMSEKSAME